MSKYLIAGTRKKIVPRTKKQLAHIQEQRTHNAVTGKKTPITLEKHHAPKPKRKKLFQRRKPTYYSNGRL